MAEASAPGSPVVFPADNEELPGYSPTREPHEHLNSLFNQNGRPWVTLKLLSEAPVGSKFPMYFSGGTIRGSAQIDLESPHTIRSVIIEVKSELGLASGDEFPPMWHERKVLWKPAETSDPKSICSVGSWKWDFSFPIPKDFDDTPNGGSTSTPLPGSFDLKPYPGFVMYRVLLFITRGKWLPNPSELHTMFAYVVRERAPAPSPLRELAYLGQYAPPGPSDDPDGWEAGSKTNIQGTLFGNRKVGLACRPYLSKPTVYSRGGTVFYRIEIASEDSQALQLLSSQSAIAVTLTRSVECSSLRKASKSALTKDLQVDVKVIAKGVSSTDKNTSTENSKGRCIVEGEIRVPPKLNPSISVALLRLRYFVTFAINVAGFVPHDQATVIGKLPTRIVSHPPIGPPPISRIPPGYEQRAMGSNENELEWALPAANSGRASFL